MAKRAEKGYIRYGYSAKHEFTDIPDETQYRVQVIRRLSQPTTCSILWYFYQACRPVTYAELIDLYPEMDQSSLHYHLKRLREIQLIEVSAHKPCQPTTYLFHPQQPTWMKQFLDLLFAKPQP